MGQFTMEKEYTYFSLRTILGFLLVFLFQRSTEAQMCSSEKVTSIKENNVVGAVVTTITRQDGVTLTLTSNPANSFEMNGNNLTAAIVLDFENTKQFTVTIECKRNEEILPLDIVIIVENVNDNEPVFGQREYTLNVSELLPIDSKVGTIEATDADADPLIYRLEPSTTGFKLQGNSPNILVQKVLDYDTVKRVTLTLYAQDSPTSTPPSFTATATIQVNILDVNNRPPWFQPCNEIIEGMSKICLNSGYKSKVNLTEQEVGPLQLKPGPLYAIDGDKGINVPIRYRFVAGNEAEIFQISENTGNITMLKAMDVEGPLTLTVMATEMTNADHFATTTVNIVVVNKSKNPPQFEKKEYEGFISADSGINSMVLDGKSSNRPLRVQAKDADFADGFNSNIRYEAQEGRGFSITPQGFILMSQNLEPGPVSLQLKAIDSSNEESSIAMLMVEVTPDRVLGAPGGYGPGEMASLGVSLAVLLVVALVIIGLLLFRIQKSKTAWRKLSEASIFRSYLGKGPGELKDGVQYTNEGFQNDEDNGSVGSKGPDEKDGMKASAGNQVTPKAVDEMITKVSAPLYTNLLSVTSSLADSDKADSEKEVKPILTKERRMEEGYKSVWFKEDIDPNAKEEVVIIPDNEEQESDDNDDDDDDKEEDQSKEEEVDDNLSPQTPNVFFSDDWDNKPRARFEDSEDEEMQTDDL
ncbi:cadherin-related family member 5 isoform X2 [Esox lucius]|uniref:Cadherin domain-containing protein n=1 Tax=Esox lucius TaxID=8010 RepID=A0A3P8XKM1_ESOLU|nr:cadherin-related family member 5 isoform X2 [Esox lucius]